MQEFKISSEDAGKRVDVFVSEKLSEFSRSALRGLFEENLITVNGRLEEPGDKLKTGDKVSIDATALSIQPENISLPILYEDKDVTVINKPAGVLTHSKGAINREATVASFIKDRLNDSSLRGNRAGIVHRLDRATSGVIITAKNSESLSKLQKQFSQRKAKKTYVAVVYGIPARPEAIIDVAIERNPKRPQTFRASAQGKPAQTRYKILKTAEVNGKKLSKLELNPLTGRTHQLRVHLAYIGHPIVGDSIYGNDEGELMLHALSLEITLPSGTRKIFSAPEPGRISRFAKNGI